MSLPYTIKLKSNIQKLRPSATLAINERSTALAAAGKKIYRLGFGQSPFPVPDEVVAALQENATAKDYLPVQGLPALRRAITEFNQRTLGISCDEEDVLVGPGSKELIFNLQLAFSGDLLLPSPSWVSYEPQAQLANNKVHWMPTFEEDAWKLTPENFRSACLKNTERPLFLILNYPNNPVGNTYTAAQLKALAAIARQYNVLIVADEIYGEVEHSGEHCSIAQFYPEGTIISSGLSKWCGAGGWRLGTFTFSKKYHWLLKTMVTIASETFTTVSAPIQYAAVTAFKGSPNIDNYLRHSRAILKLVGHYVYQKLTTLNISMPPPEGGFYLFPNFEQHRLILAQKGITTGTTLCEQLLKETGVALLPGVAFGRPSHELTARLSFVDFDGKKALEAVALHEYIPLDENFIKKHCPKIIRAMKSIEDWLV